MHTLHFITRLIIGGAQQNTVYNALDQVTHFGDRVTLVTGPGLGPEGSLEQQVRESDVDLVVLPQLRRSLHPWRDWRAYRQFRALLKELRPDVVHTHSSKAGILGRAAAHRVGIPVVHTIHGAAFHYGQHPALFRAYRSAERWAGRRTDHFISVCDAMTEQYLSAGIGSPEQYTTIYSGMDVTPFLDPPDTRKTLREQFGFTPEDVVVVKVARLFPLKGHHFLIDAAERVVARNPRVKFLLVGDGILQDELKQNAQEKGLADHIRWAGLVEPERVPELIHAGDVVAHTSEWEGLARVLVQGLLSSKPVVSFDIDGAPEVVIDNTTGRLIPFGDRDRLAGALLELASDAELRRRLGAEGRRRFAREFDHVYMTERVREVYGQLLAISY